MERKHTITHESNPLQALVGHPYYDKKPSKTEILNELLNGMAKFSGTCWSPVSLDGGCDLMFNQCPGARGYVWKINIQNKQVANWLVNEINYRKHNKQLTDEKV